jgi:hypothetical protein
MVSFDSVLCDLRLRFFVLIVVSRTSYYHLWWFVAVGCRMGSGGGSEDRWENSRLALLVGMDLRTVNRTTNRRRHFSESHEGYREERRKPIPSRHRVKASIPRCPVSEDIKQSTY